TLLYSPSFCFPSCACQSPCYIPHHSASHPVPANHPVIFPIILLPILCLPITLLYSPSFCFPYCVCQSPCYIPHHSASHPVPANHPVIFPIFISYFCIHVSTP